jgi:hypothetical protein
MTSDEKVKYAILAFSAGTLILESLGVHVLPLRMIGSGAGD